MQVAEMDVFYRHHIERKSLNQVAQELQYDYSYIRGSTRGLSPRLNRRKSKLYKNTQKHTVFSKNL